MFDVIARATYWAVGRLSTKFPRNRRGIALILVMASIAILSTSVVEFAYQTNVNAYLAANSRDDLKSYYLARSGMNLAVLLLAFQFELEKDPLVGRFMRNSNFQLYPLVNLFLSPFSSGQLTTPVGGVDLGKTGATGFGGFHGNFGVHIEPEEGKLNLNRFAKPGNHQSLMTWMCLLVGNEQHEELFSVELGGRDKDRVSREELVANIIDWIDPNKTKTVLDEFCIQEGQGSGDENAYYARNDLPYEAKNDKMTTIEELRLVHGVTDEIYETFAESFTVYPVDRVNLNLANFLVLQSLLCNHVAGANATNWPCRDPNVLNQVTYVALALDGLREFFSNPLNLLFYYMNSENTPQVLDGAKKGQTVAYVNKRQLVRYIRSFKRAPETLQQFISFSPTAHRLLGELALQVAATAPPIVIEFNERNLLRSVTTQSPKIYRVVATGSYGEVEKTLVAVVDFSDRDKGGRYLYWREY